MHHPQPHIVLVKEQRKTLIINDLGPGEYARGVRVGMPLAHAQALLPELTHVVDDDYDFSQEFLKLAKLALCFSPHIAIENFALVLNITGCAHLFGGEEALLATMRDVFLDFGMHTTMAIAPYPKLAKALAHFMPGTITTRDHIALIKTLPIDALFLDDLRKNALHDLAITTMNELLKLPRTMLAERFGLSFLHTLDQLLGVIHEPLTYLEEEPQFTYREHFSSPVRNHEQIIRACTMMLQTALTDLAAHHRALLRFAFTFTDIFKHERIITIEASQPHNSLEAWLTLLQLKTEHLSLNQGCDTLSLKVIVYRRAQVRAQDFFNVTEALTADISTMYDKIKSRLGERAIFHLRMLNHHLPEHAVKKDFSLAGKLPMIEKTPPRPLRLLKTPLPISVIALLPDNPPAKIIWKERTITILHASGPERIEAPWWTSHEEPLRDYYAVEDERGKRLWIYSTGMPKRWFIHGVFA